MSQYSNDTIPAHGVYCDTKQHRLLVLTVESRLYSLSLANGEDITLLLDNMTYNRKFISPDPFNPHRFYLSSFGSGVLRVDEVEEELAPDESESRQKRLRTILCAVLIPVGMCAVVVGTLITIRFVMKSRKRKDTPTQYTGFTMQ